MSWSDRVVEACRRNKAWRETGSGLLRWDKPEDPLFQELLTYMGPPGKLNDYWCMWHRPGGAEVPLHVHNNWRTTIYYPYGHPASLFTENGDVWLADDMFFGMEAGQAHGVRANETDQDRYSFVALFGE